MGFPFQVNSGFFKGVQTGHPTACLEIGQAQQTETATVGIAIDPKERFLFKSSARIQDAFVFIW